jgi:predicted transcriptional regulator
MQFENFNTAMTRQFNLELVILTLRDQKPRTRKRLAEETGLSIATCGNLLNDLIEQGRVIEVELEESSGGRPAKSYVYNPNHSLVAGVAAVCHEGVFRLMTVVTNLIGEIVEEKMLETTTFSGDQLEQAIDEMMLAHPLIRSLAVGVPGVVRDGEILGCDIPALAGYPLRSRIRARYNLQISIENDMNLVALGLYNQLEQDSASIIAAINFPDDSCGGSGIIIDGEIFYGHTHFAGETSYLPLGVPYDQVVEHMNKPDQGFESIVQTVISMIAIVNPAIIALTGGLVNQEMLPELIERCKALIPDKHMPKIQVLDDVRCEYLNGLVFTTLKNMSYSVSQTNNLPRLVADYIRRTTRMNCSIEGLTQD